jgi:hypothetical protein
MTAIRNESLDALVERLSPAGKAIWLEMELLAETKGERSPDHMDKLSAAAERSMGLPDKDQETFALLFEHKRRVFAEHLEREKRERDNLARLGRLMQEEGLKRGLDKEERTKLTLREIMNQEDKGK